MTWKNLWRQFQFYPGTAALRILLTLWQVWKMQMGLLVLLWYVGFTWDRLAVAEFGFVVAYQSHELLFRWYVEVLVARLTKTPMHEVDYVYPRPAGYMLPSYVSTIEGYWGPFKSDEKES